MPNTDAPPLPDAYRRLLDAQRVVTPEEQAWRAAEDKRDAQRRRIKRRLPKPY